MFPYWYNISKGGRHKTVKQLNNKPNAIVSLNPILFVIEFKIFNTNAYIIMSEIKKSEDITTDNPNFCFKWSVKTGR